VIGKYIILQDPQPRDIEDLHAAYTRELVRKGDQVALYWKHDGAEHTSINE
jgi:hypothetical protein